MRLTQRSKDARQQRRLLADAENSAPRSKIDGVAPTGDVRPRGKGVVAKALVPLNTARLGSRGQVRPRSDGSKVPGALSTAGRLLASAGGTIVQRHLGEAKSLELVAARVDDGSGG